MPEDAKEAVGHEVRAKRAKSGAISFDLLEVEAGKLLLFSGDEFSRISLARPDLERGTNSVPWIQLIYSHLACVISLRRAAIDVLRPHRERRATRMSFRRPQQGDLANHSIFRGAESARSLVYGTFSCMT
jgi:hypothetical protein